MSNKEQILYEKFLEFQQETHLKNQKKIRVGIKINILLPLIFLVISFITNRSKLVFLVLWIVSLFGIAFYLLYVEYTDFKLQEQLKELGIMEEEAEAQALIGHEVVQSIDELNKVKREMAKDIKDLKKGLKSDILQVGDKLKK
jgi:cell division protein FtsL